MRNLFLLILLLTSTLGISQMVDETASKVVFKISKLGVSTVEGTITGMTGKVNLLEGEIDVCIKTETIFTGIEKRDVHLKTEDFFHVEKFPEICFMSSSLETIDEGYLAKGTLSLHGVTKVIEIPLEVIEEKGETLLKGEFRISRLDYGIGSEAYKGKVLVGEFAEIEVNCVLK